jgi:long chain fatty acid CoA FadD26
VSGFLPALLAERVRCDPDGLAFRFVDYEVDAAGFVESLTWSQVRDRARVVAGEVAGCGSPGDRVAVMAAQGLDYLVGFLGVLEAGFVAVPLSVPVLGAHDERSVGVLADCAPVAVLTTSSAVESVVSCVRGVAGVRAPAVISVDALDFWSPLPVEGGGRKRCETALLQYTSGSTRAPKGVVVSHANVVANLDQVIADYFEDNAGVPPEGLTMVSWLPFYHDMGLLLGVMAPVVWGFPAVLMSPVGFLQRPARWLEQLASCRSFSAAPNFAFELAARRTSDADLAGLDLGCVDTILSGSERIHAETIRRFVQRFSGFGLGADVVAPSYGLAEAMVYAGSAPRWARPVTGRFDYEQLAAGVARPCGAGEGVELVSIGAPRACTVRVVDAESLSENPAGRVGEVWLHGGNVSGGYWRNAEQSAQAFGWWLADPSPGTPAGPWLRTGDLGVMADGEFYIVGRIKDLLIVDGRNHYPDDIEATIQEITGGRAVAVSVAASGSEELVAVVEFKHRGGSDAEFAERLRVVKREVKSAISRVHNVRVSDFVVVAPGSIPITTSGKVRRSECVGRYERGEFTRLDAVASADEVEAVS